MGKRSENRRLEYIGGDARGGMITIQLSRRLTDKEWERLQDFLRYDLDKYSDCEGRDV